MSAELAIGWISWALTLISNVRYNFGRRSPWDSGHQDDVAYTPFTAAFLAVWVFWVVLEILQAVYLLNFFGSNKPLDWHFIAGNILLLLWSYLFSRGHYFFSELIIIIAFVNFAIGYLISESVRARPLKKWFYTHVPVVALPLAWTNYVILWNGAVLFHARNWPSRIIANLLIWELLPIPGFFLLAFGDWATSAAFAWLSFALGLGQFATKIFALQWIFAFVIAAILAVGAFVFSFVAQPEGHDDAPLLTENDTPNTVQGA